MAAEPFFQPLPHRPMRPEDLAAVHALEVRAYEFPWTKGIFRDCLASDYPARVVERDGAIVGYFLLSIAAGARAARMPW